MKKHKISDDLLIQAILNSPTIKEAADAIGRTERAIYYRLQDRTFTERLDHERMATITAAAQALRSRLNDAIDTVYQLTKDPEVSAQTRLNACNCIITNAVKLTEQAEVIKRIERLESLNGIEE